MTRRTLFDQLELELRRLPGIVGIGFSEEDGMVIVHVLARLPEGGMLALRRQIISRARGFVDRPLVVDVQPVDAEAAAAERGRVKLVAVRVESFTKEMEVHLAHRGVQTIGRSSAGSPTNAVDATLRALTDLGAEVPFRVEAASAPVDDESHQAVIVILEPEDDTPGTRYGVARGETVEEAAARATLHALNRYLSRGPALSSAS